MADLGTLTVGGERMNEYESVLDNPAFWEELARVNKEAAIRRWNEEKLLPVWRALPWYIRCFVRIIAWLTLDS